MTKDEYTAWREETARSEKQWQTDLIHNSPEDYLIFKGGENGFYLHILKNVIHMGNYQNAIPHIGEAIFKEKGRVECIDNNAAWTRLLAKSGLPLVVDLFKVHPTRVAFPN
jgi:hypothetical protein